MLITGLNEGNIRCGCFNRFKRRIFPSNRINETLQLDNVGILEICFRSTDELLRTMPKNNFDLVGIASRDLNRAIVAVDPSVASYYPVCSRKKNVASNV